MIPLDGLLNISSGFGQNCKFLFFTIFKNFAFHLVFVVATTQTWVFIAVTLNGLKFDMLMYPDHFRADEISVIICWFSSFWHHFDLVKQTKFATSGHFLGNAREEWPELWHADVSWPPSELIKFWSRSVDFPFLASFWLSETGKIWGLWQFSSECMGGIACNLTYWCILTTFSTAYILVMVCWFS